MFTGADIDEILYTQLMQCLKLQNKEIKSVEQSRGSKINKILNVLKTMDASKIKRYTVNQIKQKRVSRKFKEVALHNDNLAYTYYFSNERIAIYTCIIGVYDKIAEPLICPDNCDFYIVTDQNIPSDSVWKKLDFNRHSLQLEKLSNVEVNRYFKMHPHILFPNYKYSIYVDGNIQPITDLTEFVNRIGDCGIAAHRHCFRNCVYDEGAVLKYLKKDNPERIEQHLAYLREQKMPCNYGLIECNVIARRHHDPICIAVMDDWWNEFMSQSKRDQLSFPHALYKNNISVDEVATLGNNVFENDAIRKNGHV